MDKPRDGGTFCGTEGRVAGRRDEGGKNPGTEGHVAGRIDEKILTCLLDSVFSDPKKNLLMPDGLKLNCGSIPYAYGSEE